MDEACKKIADNLTWEQSVAMLEIRERIEDGCSMKDIPAKYINEIVELGLIQILNEKPVFTKIGEQVVNYCTC